MKNSQILNFIKIRPVAAELFYADGQKNTQLTVFFFICNFANASKTKIPTSLPLGRSSSWGWLGLTGTRHALFSKVY